MKLANFGLLFVSIALFSGCGTLPPRYTSETKSWENTDIEVDWVVGGKLYFFSIENKTDRIIHIPKGDCSFVSIVGAVSTIDVPELIPAHSFIVVYPMVTAFPIAGPTSGIRGSQGVPVNYDRNPPFLRQYLGSYYKFGISYSIDSKTVEATIPVLINGLADWKY